MAQKTPGSGRVVQLHFRVVDGDSASSAVSALSPFCRSTPLSHTNDILCYLLQLSVDLHPEARMDAARSQDLRMQAGPKTWREAECAFIELGGTQYR